MEKRQVDEIIELSMKLLGIGLKFQSKLMEDQKLDQQKIKRKNKKSKIT